MTSPPAKAEASQSLGVQDFALFGVLTSLVSIGSSLVRSKVAAWALGPAGVGLASEVMQLLALATTIGAVASGPALVGWIAQAHRNSDRTSLRRGIAGALALGISLTLLGSAVAVIAAPWAIPHHRSQLRVWVTLAALHLVFTAITGVLHGALVGVGNPRTLTISTAMGVTLSALTAGVLTPLLGLGGYFAAMALGSGGSAFVTIILTRRAGLATCPAWSTEYSRRAFSMGSTSVLTLIVGQLLSTNVRVMLEVVGGTTRGAEYNGNYLAASQIGMQYFSVVLGGLGNYYFPRYAAAATEEDLTREVHDAADFVLRIAPPIMFAAIALREPLIHLLYDHRFDLASRMLGFQLAGDTIKTVCWAYAGPLMMRGRLRAFFLTEVLGGTMSAALNVGLILWLGPIGAGAAAPPAYCCYAVLTAMVLARSCGVPTRWSQILASVALAIVGVAVELATQRWSPLRWIVLVVVALWLWRLGALAYLRARAASVLAKVRRSKGNLPSLPEAPANAHE